MSKIVLSSTKTMQATYGTLNFLVATFFKKKQVRLIF